MGAIVWVFLGLLAFAVLGLAWVLFQIMRQQGRLLLRLESLERLGLGADVAGSVEPNGSPRQERGLSLATVAPPFRLSDLDGRLVALEDFRGQRVLLVHWDTACGFCDQIAPELARLQGDLRKHKTELVLISYGDADTNRSFAQEHGLDCAILLQHEGEPVQAFAHLGTPVAYLLDEKGRVAKPLHSGQTRSLGSRARPPASAGASRAGGRWPRAGSNAKDSQPARRRRRLRCPILMAAPSPSTITLAGGSCSFSAIPIAARVTHFCPTSPGSTIRPATDSRSFS